MQSKFTTATLFTLLRSIRYRSSSHLAFDGVVDTKGSSARPHPAEEPPVSPALSIPSPDPTGEERACDMYQTAGQRLARQEDWPGISRAIRDAEAAATRTPGGMPVADLMAFGARADVVHAAEHALLSGRPAKDAPLLDGIIALEEVLAEFPDDFVIATVVALAHIDIGWAWRGTGWAVEVPLRNREACATAKPLTPILTAPAIYLRTSRARIFPPPCWHRRTVPCSAVCRRTPTA
ncbi:hypothetical protein [Pseudosulfitobacter pseudonitzschiae]|uniref:hypothetical protein n=1 Tax=Pseudosulfitobacter pseudonitzschiae TaxID=1402135 RepID=UPI001E4B2598|nr:hypothetical protein [Pseudosulfitobacter pseudonitzschiae]UFF50038.1 hypothetical protein LOE12_16595 [Pseudosulfitobacter pseudonitzschiae]